MKRRFALLVVATAAAIAPSLGLLAPSAHAGPGDHIWWCVGVAKPVDMSYCQYNPWAYPPLNGQLPPVPAVPVPVPSI